jgi:hypothetical protein
MSKQSLIVDDKPEQEDGEVPQEVEDAAKTVAVWGVKFLVTCLSKKKKAKPKKGGGTKT